MVRLRTRRSGVRVPPGAPLISLESNTCSHFQNWLGFDFQSIRSNNDLFARKLKSQANPFSDFFAEFDVGFQLRVDVSDLFVRVSHPEVLQVLRNSILPEPRETKATKRMRSSPPARDSGGLLVARGT